MKKVLFVGSECEPFIKTGGLGNVVGSLPRYIDPSKVEVRIVLPCYECMDTVWKEQMSLLAKIPVYLGDEMKVVDIKSLDYQGIICYFIEQPEIFAGPAPYADMWQDTGKFIFFCKAVLEMLSYIDYEPEILHCHDWQTGLLPAMLKTLYAKDPYFGRMKTIMTVHNLRFQGIADINYVKYATGMPDEAFTYDHIEYHGMANMLKAGLAYADVISTVSETYAKEIQTSEYGEGLDGLLRYREKDLIGIVNGIDYDVYNPMKDSYLEDHYDVTSFIEGKRQNKLTLQRMAGLPEDPDAFVIGIVSRLTDQKGFDLVGMNMDQILREHVQVIVLGGGEPRYEEMFSGFQKYHTGKCFVNFNYNDRMAKYIYAGSDASLMPSRFEPCGLSQLMAFRYGTVPIVRLTGGLKDTVIPYDPETKEGTGFGFGPYNSHACVTAIAEALFIYESDKDEWNALVKRCMEQDFSWSTSAKKYEDLYLSLK